MEFNRLRRIFSRFSRFRFNADLDFGEDYSSSKSIISIAVFISCISISSYVFCQNNTAAGEYITKFVPHEYSTIWRGHKKDTLFPSRILGYDKNVSIFTPVKFGLNPEEKYPLIIMFDRQDRRIIDNLLQSVDLLESYGQTPRMVVIGLESGRGPDQRRREAKWGIDGGNAYGEKYDQFIFDELMPYMVRNYRIDLNQVIVYGHSWFGYHSSMILINHIPDLLAVISASPCCLSSDRIDDIVHAITHSGPLEHKFFYRVASGHDIGDDLNVYRELTGKIALSRLPEKFDYKAHWFASAMHMEVPGLLFHQALYDIYSDWSDLAFAYADPANHPTYNDEALYDSLQSISDGIYGFRIPIYDRHMEMRIEYYRYIRDQKVTLEGRIATWEFMISRYGEDPELLYNIANNYFLLGDFEAAKKYIRNTRKFQLDKELAEKLKELENRVKQKT